MLLEGQLAVSERLTEVRQALAFRGSASCFREANTYRGQKQLAVRGLVGGPLLDCWRGSLLDCLQTEGQLAVLERLTEVKQGFAAFAVRGSAGCF